MWVILTIAALGLMCWMVVGAVRVFDESKMGAVGALVLATTFGFLSWAVDFGRGPIPEEMKPAEPEFVSRIVTTTTINPPDGECPPDLMYLCIALYEIQIEQMDERRHRDYLDGD